MVPVVFTRQSGIARAIHRSGLNPALAFAGRPLMPNDTVPLYPLFVVTPTVKPVLLPAEIVCTSGLAATAKVPTISLTMFVCETLPPVPTTFNEYDPGGVELVVEIERVTLVEAYIERRQIDRRRR